MTEGSSGEQPRKCARTIDLEDLGLRGLRGLGFEGFRL